FYELLPRQEKLPTTSPSSPGRYMEAIRRTALRCSNVLCITVNRGFSGMFDSARAAAELAKPLFPGVTIEVLDSGTAAGAQGLVVLAAARAAAVGRSLAQVMEAARSMVPRVHLVAVIDTLHYLAKGGRVPQVAAWATSLLQIKPVIRLLPSGGGASLVARVRTKPRAVRSMMSMVKRMAGKEPLHAIVHHSNAPDEAEDIRRRLASEFNCAELYVKDFTPAMGVHTGPGLLAVAFYAGE
ncbi:MAG: DegV family protein, partial [Chloroflexota bacterium]